MQHLDLFKGLKKSGYGGYLSCEASGGDDPAAVAKHEFNQMQKLLRRIQLESKVRSMQRTGP